MQSIAPRSVPPRNALEWMREGARLVWRKIMVHAAVSVAMFGVIAFVQDDVAGILMFLLAPLFVAVFVVVAESTDRSIGLRQAVVGALAGLQRVLLFSAGMFTVLATIGGICAFLDGAFQMDDQRRTIDMARYLLVAPAESIALAEWFVIPVFLLGLPLAVVGRIPLASTWRLGLDAYRKNLFIVGLSLVASVAIIGGMIALAGFSAIALYPLTGATMYVAYRDVFLGVPPQKMPKANRVKSFQG